MPYNPYGYYVGKNEKKDEKENEYADDLLKLL